MPSRLRAVICSLAVCCRVEVCSSIRTRRLVDGLGLGCASSESKKPLIALGTTVCAYSDRAQDCALDQSSHLRPMQLRSPAPRTHFFPRSSCHFRVNCRLFAATLES